MIVRDEERLLPTCLAAAKALSDDVCIVDTGSHDRSVAVARALGARVVQSQWHNDFARARNESLTLAQKPWVVVLDADEQISPAAVGEIHAQIRRSEVGALSLSIVDEQQHGGTRVSHVLRAWRHDATLTFRHRIHEDISWAVFPRLRALGQVLVHITAPIAHLGYGAAHRAQKNKRARDEQLLNLCIAEDPNELYSWFKLLELGSIGRDVKLARRAAGRAQALMRKANVEDIEHFLGDLILYLEQDAAARGVPAQQRLGWVRTWAQAAPREPTLGTLEGQLCELLGDVAGAASAFQRALEGEALRPHVQMRQVRPTLGLARLAVAGGRLGEGLALARRALAWAPEDPEALVAVAGIERLQAQAG